MEITSTKRVLRKKMALAKQQLTEEQRNRESYTIRERLEKHPRFQQAQNILIYHSLPDEPSTQTLIQKWNRKKQFFLPVVDGNTLQLRPLLERTQLIPNQWGIQEPLGNNLCSLSQIELAIIPGVAFDIQGHRLGRGRGFYDTLLSQLDFQAYTIGVCFSVQLISSVPFDEKDQLINEVITLYSV